MSGFTDEFYKAITADFLASALPAKPAYYSTDDTPSIWLPPTRVWELRAADFTLSPVHRAAQGMVHEQRCVPPRAPVQARRAICLTVRPRPALPRRRRHRSGVSARFPRFIRERADKGVTDATTSEQVAAMFRAQSTRAAHRPAVAADTGAARSEGRDSDGSGADDDGDGDSDDDAGDAGNGDSDPATGDATAAAR